MADRGDVARAYRKKPVVVEAVQWTGENHAEMCEFIDPEAFEIIPRIGLVIHTLEGDHHASPGDYIIKGVNGEFYPCKPDIFAKTYESSTLTPPNEWVSVEERLPEKHSEYIVCACDEGEPIDERIWGDTVVVCADYYDGAFTWYEGNTEYDISDIVTHWMELPAPPGKDNNVPAASGSIAY